MSERPHIGPRSTNPGSPRMGLDSPGDDTGIGMKNVQERIEVLYGAEASFKVVSSPGRGALISIEIPADLPNRSNLASLPQDGAHGSRVNVHLHRPAEGDAGGIGRA